MKDIKDYLHLYLGCKVLVCDVDGQTFIDQIESVIKNTAGHHLFSIYEFGDCTFDDDTYYQWIKPILRPLGSMTQEERVELWNMIFWYKFPDNGHSQRFNREITRSESRWVLSAGVERLGIEDNGEIWADSDLSHYKHNKHEITRWFLTKHFDVFNLIESGLAIDATTTKTN